MSKKELSQCVAAFVGGLIVALALGVPHKEAKYLSGKADGYVEATERYAHNLGIQEDKFYRLEKKICPK